MIVAGIACLVAVSTCLALAGIWWDVDAIRVIAV